MNNQSSKYEILFIKSTEEENYFLNANFNPDDPDILSNFLQYENDSLLIQMPSVKVAIAYCELNGLTAGTLHGKTRHGYNLIWEKLKAEVRENLTSMPLCDRIPYLHRLDYWFSSKEKEIASYPLIIKQLEYNINFCKKEVDASSRGERPYYRRGVINNYKEQTNEYMCLITALDTLDDIFMEGSLLIKRYLKLEHTQSVQSQNKKTKKENKEVFDEYIYEQYRANLIPFLTNTYTGSNPEEIIYMLYALVDCSYMPKEELNKNQSALHRALKATFGSVGTRQNLNLAITRLNGKQSAKEIQQIKEHSHRIGKHLQFAI